MKKQTAKLVFLLAIFFMLPNFAQAGRYFDQSEIGTLSVPDCDTVKVPTCKTYFIDGTNGDDSWDGLSATHTTGTHGPFKTIGFATNHYFRNNGGDVYKIRAGTYRNDAPDLQSATGNVDEDHRITIASYGDGEVILNSAVPVTWTQYDSNIYQAPFNINQGEGSGPVALIADDNYKLCRPVQSMGGLTSFCKWYYDDVAKIVYVHMGGDTPAAHNLEAISRDRYTTAPTIYVNTPYATLYGLTIKNSGSVGISGTSYANHLRVEHCKIKHTGKSGLSVGAHYGYVSKNEVSGNVLFNWPRGSEYGTSGMWPSCLNMNDGDSIIAGNIVHDCGGEGINVAGGSNNIYEDNISYDNWSVNIYMDNVENMTVRRNLIYCTTPDPSDIMDSNLIPEYTNADEILKRMWPQGMSFSDETATQQYAHSYGHRIYDNLIINCRGGITHGDDAPNDPARSNPNDHNFVIANNTIVLPSGTPPGNANFVGLTIPDWQAMTYKNNIIIATEPSSVSRILQMPGGTVPADVSINNNLYFAPGAAPISTGYYPNEVMRSFSGWQSFSSQDSNSALADPLFAGGADMFNPAYYIPQSASPARGMGANLSTEFTTDFNHFTKAIPMTVGALDYGSVYVESGSDTTPPSSPTGLAVT